MSRRSLLFGVTAVAIALLAVGVVASAGPTAPEAGSDTSEASVVADDDRPRVVSTNVQPRIVDVPNTTNYLMPSADPTRQGYTTRNVDVASAVSTSGARLDGDHRSRTFRTRYENAGSAEGRLGVVESTVDDVETRVERLDAEQEELFRAYSNGTLSRAELVDRLVRLDARATQSRATLHRVRQRVQADPTTTLSPSLETRIAALQSELVVLPAPLSERLAASATGEADPLVTYVGGVDDALVLGAVDGDRFYRQATVRSAYRGPGSTNISEAFALITDLYPWVYSGGEQFAPTFGPASTGIGLYRLDATHPQGSLTAYLSGSTTAIFHESQTLDSEAVPVYDTVTNQNASLNLTVTTTTETGPMRVDLRDRQTGDPLNGTLLVDGEPVATTGDDGTLWTVRPAGPFEVTVLSDGERVTLGRGYFFR